MTTPADARGGSLVRAIGVVGLAAGIVNITIGGGIFRLPADAARLLGPAAPIALVTCALAMGLVVLCLAEAGSRVDATGGPYAYVEVALGPLAGFLAGFLLWITGTLATSAVAVVLAANVAQVVPLFGTRLGAALFLAVVFAVLSAINVVGVRQGTALVTAFTVAKLLPLLALVAIGPFFVDPARLVWAAPPAPATVARVSALLVFAFAGIESALTPSGEVRDVARTIPRAIFLAMGAVTLLYIALQVVAQGVLGAALATSPAPLAEVGGRILGPAGRVIVLAGASVSMLGNVSGMTLAIPRALFAFARDGFLPASLAAVHPRYRTPHVAIVVQSVLAFALAATSTFERLAILATSSLLVLYAGCCVAAAQLRRRDVRAGGAPLRVPGGGLAPWAACAAIGWLFTGLSGAEWAALGGALALATAIFFLTARTRAARSGYAD
jgi:basic amino acid/polyamine antiporter, APA family